jgi:hypothetical protein
MIILNCVDVLNGLPFPIMPLLIGTFVPINIDTYKCFSVYIQLFTTFGVQNFEKLRIHNGFLPATYAENANRCFEELKKHITPDGYLKGAAQDNRAECPYKRVITGLLPKWEWD